MLMRRMTEPQPLNLLRGEMDRLFERFFGDYEPFRAWEPGHLRHFPAVNIWQDDDHLYVEAEMPGLTQDDVELSVTGNELTIKGQRPELPRKEGTTVHRRERGTGAFGRLIHLPFEVDEKRVEAMFCNGVLEITLPKAEIARVRHIPVRTLAK